ncbi:hypothetical protein MHK_000324 [Candidatus Magnetomorum sp. HK-1]|nr:hypothetical protein MHK_000324 [Candidatus Magnetomorum sp. HK-1]
MKNIFITNILIVLLMTGIAVCEERIHFTNSAIELHGFSSLLNEGDIISVYDSDNILCGKSQVQVNGQYGLMSVYRDDPLTKNIDEGAEPGDILSVYLNDKLISPVNIDTIVWTQNGDLIQIDF